MDGKVRLLLVDDHSLFREALLRLLASDPDFEIVGNCFGIRDALGVLGREKVDLVLLDYDLGPEWGVTLISKLQSLSTKPRILMVTAGMPQKEILSALADGVAGIFLKHSPPAQLVEAIRTVMSGEMWLDPRAVRPVVDRATQTSATGGPTKALTARENSVLKAVFEGATNRRIATTLNISESSVKATLQQIFTKAGVRTRSQLVRFALEHEPDWLAGNKR